MNTAPLEFTVDFTSGGVVVDVGHFAAQLKYKTNAEPLTLLLQKPHLS